ncbi:processing protease-like protein [Paenibacillus larvae subsp. larvae]|uniref:Processing protease-like protein n=1 Tax=Paenibacillus larvae subsp. larvae TaxID=147375 RepID=A0A2L1U1L2_9BACL|nr:pitrilysin family protein [Paenibacillus larvae]AQT83609.1 peptidase M16 [Paenibacillus larvae subsp. pulvifaciens]AQZ48724.1 peptidase M16 [Paenibacillus larvae subsp. pulvifaciens]AVF26812.1 processing protease-like protein [Paenibacillus larvae subsp. larvae]AVF31561.1 processing protease-like protein [Paenibacillus larvae subsp. larvae]MBH0342528.1 zinc protease [Paenibacillus larvae]
MKQIPYPHLQETLYTEKMPGGLQVFILPKAGFKKTYATFTTRYGSVDNHFQVEGREEIRVPDGIAHFLEHKMFEEQTGDIFSNFANKGASANAFTSFDRTTYLFTATEHIEDNLTTLIDFVQHPYFTDENVEKEKGIIGQEIQMYRDNPDWRSYYGLIEAMYSKHPIRIDIAGTVESISKITKGTLYECYNTFYHPSNMILFVVGGINPESIMELIRSNQAAKTFEPQGMIRRYFEQEPYEIQEKKRVIVLPVSLPKCLFGIKEMAPGVKGRELLVQELTTKLVLDYLFSSSSDLYQQLYDEGLISDSFGYEYNSTAEYAFSMVGGDTRDPGKLIDRIKEEVNKVIEKGLDEKIFERTRKKKIGNFLRMLNSPEAIANEFTKYRMKQIDLFDFLEVYKQISLQQATQRLREHFNWDQMAISIVRSDIL